MTEPPSQDAPTLTGSPGEQENSRGNTPEEVTRTYTDAEFKVLPETLRKAIMKRNAHLKKELKKVAKLAEHTTPAGPEPKT